MDKWYTYNTYSFRPKFQDWSIVGTCVGAVEELGMCVGTGVGECVGSKLDVGEIVHEGAWVGLGVGRFVGVNVGADVSPTVRTTGVDGKGVGC